LIGTNFHSSWNVLIYKFNPSLFFISLAVIIHNNTSVVHATIPKTVSANVFSYISPYPGKGIAFSNSGNDVIYLLPVNDYSRISHIIKSVVVDYDSNRNLYYTIVDGNPFYNITNLKYIPIHQKDAVVFANKGGDDLNFFEAYAFGNVTEPFTAIIAMNVGSYHIAYVTNNSVYDVFRTYNIDEYIGTYVYMYNPTAVYVIIFDTWSLSLTTIMKTNNAHSVALELNGTLNDTPIMIAENQDTFVIQYDGMNITRDRNDLIINNVKMNYYPVGYTMWTPIDPVFVDNTQKLYMYFQGNNYTLIPTSIIMENSITMIAYQIDSNGIVGNATITYYN
jgi:hypothetical protein